MSGAPHPAANLAEMGTGWPLTEEIATIVVEWLETPRA